MKNNRVAALRHLHDKLKSGEYDGTDVMAAWIAVEDLACLLERAENEPVLEWQPIDTAPKDGASILGYVLPPRMQASLEGPRVVKWAGEFGMWSMPGISGLTCSHWMPVPSGPTKGVSHE